jgi:hypothetical protein
VDAATYSRIVKAQESFHAQAMKIPGVFATGIGRKCVAGGPTDIVAICVHVTKKKPPGEVPAAERIPPAIDGFATDVIEGEPPVAITDDGKYRPLQGGTEVGIRFQFGTIGCIVRDRTDNKVCVLSNQHVLGGDGTQTFQPATYVVCDQIGETKRSAKNKYVDCAISDLNTYDDGGIGQIVGIGKVEGTYNLTWGDLGSTVMKRGVTTLLTTGTVANINWSGRDQNGNEFAQQILIDPGTGNFADYGDSGSALVDAGKRIVGLVWAISVSGGHNRGVANTIANVMSELNVDVVTGVSQEALRLRRETTIDRIEALLCLSERGRAYWQTYLHFQPQLRHLFLRVPRLYVLWQSMPQRELLDLMLEASADPDAAIPATVGTRDTVKVLTHIRDMVMRYVDDPALRRQIDALHADITQNIGASWRVALGDASVQTRGLMRAEGSAVDRVSPRLQ